MGQDFTGTKANESLRLQTAMDKHNADENICLKFVQNRTIFSAYGFLLCWGYWSNLKLEDSPMVLIKH